MRHKFVLVSKASLVIFYVKLTAVFCRFNALQKAGLPNMLSQNILNYLR